VQVVPHQRHTTRRRDGDPLVVTVPQAAELLGISKDLAYDLARRGELPGAVQLGRRWIVSLVRLQNAVHGEDGTAQLAGSFGQDKPE
jgi:excisionase family DNA binding protein